MRDAPRSARREVASPVLGLPAARHALDKLDPFARAALRDVLLSVRDDARRRADLCWRKHKAPMAVYWKAVGVYANHIARALG